VNEPKLLGYNYSLELGRTARDKGELLALRVETSLMCNMKCKYCGWNSGMPLEDEIDFDTLTSFIDEGKNMGAKSIIIIGGGEPTIYKYFIELVKYINRLKLIPVVITNGLTMDQALSEMLYNNNCSILFKCDSLKPQTQDYLSGVQGAFIKMQRGLNILKDIGFTKVSDPSQLRLGLSFVLNKKNIDEACDIWRFCRNNNIYPNLELLNPIGRSEKYMAELVPNNMELQKVLKRIKDIDENEYHIKHINYHKQYSHCLQHIYSVYLNVQGYVQPCGAIRVKKYNYKDSSLSNILNNEYFQKVRLTEDHLDANVELTSFSL